MSREFSKDWSQPSSICSNHCGWIFLCLDFIIWLKKISLKSHQSLLLHFVAPDGLFYEINMGADLLLVTVRCQCRLGAQENSRPMVGFRCATLADSIDAAPETITVLAFLRPLHFSMFSCEYWKIFKNSFFTEFFRWVFLHYFKSN